ncbi:hypothetical protein [Streptomyces sp. SID13031]|uniref:hypothetical protein n=1 Tax=Streptomyces sp. SID13031 TaxID=2706046 RepID=UPI0013C8342E|nr:hypothetical protein [Streptomyces sp. SID13031]NEA34494.1 hypothetical protein [Streptomyces sp. SID13031]
MAVAVFVDTSILLNLLDVPKRNGERETVTAEFLAWQQEDATFVLPITTVIETGNAVAKIEGGSRWSFVEKFVQILGQAVVGATPWAASGAVWNADFIQDLIDGHGHVPALPMLMKSDVGVGDAGILAEMEQYRARVPSATPIRIWTLDAQLGAFGN